MKKLFRPIAVFALVIAFALPVLASEVEVQLDDANSRQEELQQEVANSQARLEELQNSKAEIEQKISEIDAEIEQVDALIAQYDSEASDKELQIEDLEGQISDQEDELQAKYDKMKLRIKYMYENLDANYIEAIFSSQSFGEFFEKTEYIAALNKYDRRMMDDIEALSQSLKENKSTVEEELEVVQALGEAQEEQKVVLDDLQVMKSGELANTEVAIEEEAAEMAALNAMLEENSAYIAQLSAEYDAMLAAGGQPDPEAEAAAQEAEAEAAAQAEAAAAAQAEADRLAAEVAEAEQKAAEAETAGQAVEEAQQLVDSLTESGADEEEIAAAAAAQAEAEAAAAAAAEQAAAAEAEAAQKAEEAAAAAQAAEEAAAAQAEADQKAAEAREQADSTVTGEAGVSTGTWIWPVPGYTEISSGFGDRGGEFHAGIDIPAPEGSDIVAVDGGKVVMARWSAGADTGNYTVIYHGNGVYSEYMHQSNIYVSEGDIVAQGQSIGAVGNTGNSYGSHLHLSEGIGDQYWTNRVAPPF